jgi:hypothetical protein
VLVLGIKESGGNTRDIKEHWYTNLHERLDYTVFFLLDHHIFVIVNISSICSVDQAVDEDDKIDC